MNKKKYLMHQFISKYCILLGLFHKTLTEATLILHQLTLQIEKMHKLQLKLTDVLTDCSFSAELNRYG